MNVEQTKKYEAKAYAHIVQVLPEDIFHQFQIYPTSKTLWDALEIAIEGNASYRKMKGKALKNEFNKFVCMNNEGLNDMIERFYHLLTEMHNHDIMKTDAEVVQCLADALPQNWDLFTMVLMNTGDLSRFSLNQFVSMLKEHELNIEYKQKRINTEACHTKMAAKGAFLNIPPLLNDIEDSINFRIWKKRFKVFIKATNPRLWTVIEFGDYIPRKVTQDGKTECSLQDEFKVRDFCSTRFIYRHNYRDSLRGLSIFADIVPKLVFFASVVLVDHPRQISNHKDYQCKKQFRDYIRKIGQTIGTIRMVEVAPPLLEEPDKLINFILWKRRFEFFVKGQSQRVWEIIEFGNSEVVTQESEWSYEDETKVRENYLALHMLYSALHDNTFHLMFRCNTAHDIWETLAVMYEGKDYRIRYLTREFEAFCMVKGENIDQMYGRFNRIVISLKALGKTFTNERCVERFLTALPYEWDFMVSLISQKENLYVRSLEDVIGHLKALEINMLKKVQKLR